MKEFKKCLVNKCEREACSRGLCMACFVSAKRYVKSGKITEEKLINRGLILPSKTKGGISPLRAALQEIESQLIQPTQLKPLQPKQSIQSKLQPELQLESQQPKLSVPPWMKPNIKSPSQIFGY